MTQKQKDLVMLALRNLGAEFGTNVAPIMEQLERDEIELRGALERLKRPCNNCGGHIDYTGDL